VHDPTQPLLNASAVAALYAELASGAETGWGYSVWWLANVHVGNASQGLRALNVRGMVPVDSNTIPV
jgi:alpha,alpha-trehalase